MSIKDELVNEVSSIKEETNNIQLSVSGMKETVNEMLQQVDGFMGSSNVVISRVEGVSTTIGEHMAGLAVYVDSDSQTWGQYALAQHEAENTLRAVAVIPGEFDNFHFMLMALNNAIDAITTVIAAGNAQTDTLLSHVSAVGT